MYRLTATILYLQISFAKKQHQVRVCVRRCSIPVLLMHKAVFSLLLAPLWPGSRPGPNSAQFRAASNGPELGSPWESNAPTEIVHALVQNHPPKMRPLCMHLYRDSPTVAALEGTKRFPAPKPNLVAALEGTKNVFQLESQTL